MNDSLRIAVAIAGKDGRVLVQRRLRRGGFVHEFPAGRVEEGEDFTDAAVRELREETGLESTPSAEQPVLGTTPEGHAIAYVFLDVLAGQQLRPPDPARRQTFFWMTLAEVAAAPFIGEFPPSDRAFLASRT